jgi:hypothetical protein
LSAGCENEEYCKKSKKNNQEQDFYLLPLECLKEGYVYEKVFSFIIGYAAITSNACCGECYNGVMVYGPVKRVIRRNQLRTG